MASPVLCTTKERYLIRMSIDIDPSKPNFGESQWITSEDVNVEHLLDVFMTIDADLDYIWDACADFMEHLFWHKSRLTLLKPKIEGLPDDCRSKPGCLFGLSRLFREVGDLVECKRLLNHLLWREQGDDEVATTLMELSEANRLSNLPKEGIEQAKEAFEVYERLGDTRRTECLIQLTFLLCKDEQFDTAEDAAFRAIALLPGKGEECRLCESHRALGDIYQSGGKAVSR